jgi:hypothetical protein
MLGTHTSRLAAVWLPVAAAWLLVAAPVSGQVRLAIDDGRVSLDATDATLREILEEWQRVGQTSIFNVERVTGGPLTIRLEDVPEERALEILLRALNGYVAAPRATGAAGASRFDRIMLMPGYARPRSAAVAPAAAPVGNDLLTQAPALPEPEDEGEERPVRIIPAPDQRRVPFRAFPPTTQPSPAAQPQPTRPVYSPQPVAPPGVPIPGMIIPVPEESPEPAPAQSSSGS